MKVADRDPTDETDARYINDKVLEKDVGKLEVDELDIDDESVHVDDTRRVIELVGDIVTVLVDVALDV